MSLAKEAVQEIRDYIKDNFSSEYLPSTQPTYKSKTKNAQESHEAIRPTSILRTPDSMRDHLTADQARLYEMIWKRTLACQMAPARFDTVSVDIRLGGDTTLFRANGQVLVFPGFIGVYMEDVDDATEEEGGKLPPLAEGDVLPIDKLYGEQHFTQPPPRYSEASLVKALEEHGIGRPSTYATIISTLQAREYAVLDKKRFIPTDVGRVVTRFLTDHFTRYVDYGFTAHLEDELDEVSEGKRDWIGVMDEFWKGFSKLIKEKADIDRPVELIDEACPECGKPLAKKLSRYGSFISCTNYPECKYKRSISGESQDDASARVELGVHPDTKQPVLLLRGPYGHYVQLGEAVEGRKGQAETRLLAQGNAARSGRSGQRTEAAVAAARTRRTSRNRQESHRQHRPLRSLHWPRRQVQIHPAQRQHLRHQPGTRGGIAGPGPRRQRRVARAG